MLKDIARYVLREELEAIEDLHKGELRRKDNEIDSLEFVKTMWGYTTNRHRYRLNRIRHVLDMTDHEVDMALDREAHEAQASLDPRKRKT